jgi:hypothetical protein
VKVGITFRTCIAALALLFAFAGCGDDDGASIGTSPGPPAKTTPATGVTTEATGSVLSPSEAKLIDAAVNAVSAFCVLEAQPPGATPRERRRLIGVVDSMIRVYRRRPDRLHVPPGNPTEAVPVRNFLRRTAQVLRVSDCSPAAAARLERATRSGD